MIEYLTEQEVLNMDTNYIIETKNLTKQYGSQKSVADLNIHVKLSLIHIWKKFRALIVEPRPSGHRGPKS